MRARAHVYMQARMHTDTSARAHILTARDNNPTPAPNRTHTDLHTLSPRVLTSSFIIPVQFIFLNNPHAYLPFFTNHITVHLPSLPQGGGSYTKKDPNGPPVDHKGAKFQCGIRADFQKSLLWLPPTGNSLLSPFLFCPLDCHQVFAHCDSTIIP
jgi:hypothetical protein